MALRCDVIGAMTEAPPSRETGWAVPPEALTEWLTLAEEVDRVGAVPCRTSDAEAWWPDRSEVDRLPARMALDACGVCDARAACLAYAVAAQEPAGIWGGTTPADRSRLRADLPLRTTYVSDPDELRRAAHARRVAEWRKRSRYAETSRSA